MKTSIGALDLEQSAEMLAKRFAISDEGRAELTLCRTLGQALERLQARQLWPDALHLLAQALPSRVLVEWAWAAVETITDQPESARQLQAQVRLWLSSGEEQLRFAAYRDALALGTAEPAACVALAAYWSEGSMHDASLPELLPPAGLCQHAAACAVQLAGVTLAEQAAGTYQCWIALALEIAAGKRVFDRSRCHG